MWNIEFITWACSHLLIVFSSRCCFAVIITISNLLHYCIWNYYDLWKHERLTFSFSSKWSLIIHMVQHLMWIHRKCWWAQMGHQWPLLKKLSSVFALSLSNFKMMHLSVKWQAVFLSFSDLRSAFVYVELEWPGGGTSRLLHIKVCLKVCIKVI